MFKRGYANTPKGQIHYATAGDGPPLLLLHQGPRSSRNFWQLMPLLAPHYRCFALDTLGFGNSDPAPPGVRFEDLAQSVVDAMDDLDLEKAHIFGIHTGNKIGTAVGAGHPERVDRLILAGQPHSLIVDQEKRNAAIHALVSHFRRFDDSLSEAEAMQQWSAAFAGMASGWWDAGVLGRRDSGMARFRSLEYRLLDLVQARPSMYESVRANFSYDLIDGMAKLDVPTLVIELATPAEEHFGRQGPALIKLMKRAKLATIENSGPDIIEWGCERLATVILDYLKSPHP